MKIQLIVQQKAGKILTEVNISTYFETICNILSMKYIFEE